MAYNDSKHTSKLAQQFLEKQVNCWRTPAESPDLNPFENLWHELKEYMRREVKPKNKEELINGIKAFWRTVTPQVGVKYIRHLKKAIIINLSAFNPGYIGIGNTNTKSSSRQRTRWQRSMAIECNCTMTNESLSNLTPLVQGIAALAQTIGSFQNRAIDCQ
ncbi:hypothetical protein EMCRGX_G023051 [Ephydatia muelleri]